MSFPKPSTVAVAIGTMLSLLAVPSAGHAGLFDCLFPSPIVSPAPGPARQVSWMPVVGDPCGQPVTLVPEKKRRWTYSRIPKTTFKPVTTCDPCTGCPVTAYRPKTTYSLLPWLHPETYTIYKPVSTSAASCNPCVQTTCDPCGGGVTFSYGSGCSTCAPSAVTSSSVGSAQSQADPGYLSRKPVAEESESSRPDKSPSTQGQGTPTQEQGTGDDLKPKPDNLSPTNTSTELPELHGPGGRTAARPIESPSQVRAVSWELSAAPASPPQPASKPKLDCSGWHAVTD